MAYPSPWRKRSEEIVLLHEVQTTRLTNQENSFWMISQTEKDNKHLSVATIIRSWKQYPGFKPTSNHIIPDNEAPAKTKGKQKY